MKKLLSLALVLVMAFTLTTPVFAANQDGNSQGNSSSKSPSSASTTLTGAKTTQADFNALNNAIGKGISISFNGNNQPVIKVAADADLGIFTLIAKDQDGNNSYLKFEIDTANYLDKSVTFKIQTSSKNIKYSFVLSHIHDYVETITATCTASGFKVYTCDCGDSYVGDEVPALGHTAGADADCTNDQVCTVCGEVLVAKLGHTVGADADCTNDQVCTVCGEVLVAKLGHTAGADADCTNDQVCTVCGEVLVAALGHDWDNGVYTNPTRASDGFTTYKCEVCGETKVEVDEGSKWVVISATATVANVSGNTYRITVTEKYSGGPDEVYTANYAFNTIPNNGSQTFNVGPYKVTVSRSGGTYTPVNPPQGIAPAFAPFSFGDEANNDDFFFEAISVELAV